VSIEGTTQSEQLVYGTEPFTNVGYEPSLVVLPRGTAEDLARRWDVVNEVATWGELRTRFPDLYEECLGLAGYTDLEAYSTFLEVGTPMPGVYEEAARQYDEVGDEPPGDTDPFDATALGAFNDGDWPPSSNLVMTDVVPPSVVEAFGESYETVLNGRYTELRGDRTAEVVAALEALGFRCVEDQPLIDRLHVEC
jgi:hypothetical protein